MHTSFQILGLERLASRRGVDVRQTALRVATDLFCQTERPTRSDVRCYEQLADGLLPYADVQTRLEIARKLVTAPHAPPLLLEKLKQDADPSIAAVVLASCAPLPADDLPAILAQCGPLEAAALASRHDLDGSATRVLAVHPHPLVAEALLENAAAPLDDATLALLVRRGQDDPAVRAGLFARQDIPALALASLYGKATPPDRARIRADVVRAAASTSSALPRGSFAAIKAAVSSRDLVAVADALAQALGAEPAAMARIFEDPEGDLFLLALAAVGYSRSEAVAAMLVLAPDEVRTSVAKIFAVADLHDDTPRWVARYLVGQAVGALRPAAPAHAPHLHPSKAPSRTSRIEAAHAAAPHQAVNKAV